jgi:hypothetical protein
MNSPRTIPLQPEWIDWWREQLRVMNDGSVVAIPWQGSVEVVYKVDHGAKTLTLIVEHPSFHRESYPAVLTERCPAELGYRVVYLENPARTLPR